MKKAQGCPAEWQPKVLLKVLRGSRAYGLEVDSSDTDTSTVYIQPTRSLLSLYIPNAYVRDRSEDATIWELHHFLGLATNANPAVLEAFLAPVMESLPEGEALRQLLPCVLRRKSVFGVFTHVAAQFGKVMLEDKIEYRRRKGGANCLRTLYNGIELLTQGTFSVRIADTAIGNFVKAAKVGDLSTLEVLKLAEELQQKLNKAYSMSKLPDDQDRARINDFLLEVRKTYW